MSGRELPDIKDLLRGGIRDDGIKLYGFTRRDL